MKAGGNIAPGEMAEGSLQLIYQPALTQCCSLETDGAVRGVAEMAERDLTEG